MRPVRTYRVLPSLPEKLKPLLDLAYNLRWSWDHETIDLFRRLDRELWEDTGHNPVLMLGTIPQERLREVERDDAFLAHLDRVAGRLREYQEESSTWYRRTFGPPERPLAAYFSMEFGITECLPIYSGGLGILAADHLKSASDLGLPLVGVGLLYQKGYFHQYLNPEGYQQERYPVNDFHNLPVRRCRDAQGRPVRITLDLGGQRAEVQLWKAQVGRVPLILLDTNTGENSREIQDVTDSLYGGGDEMRVQQEIVLGVGGVRALAALGMTPQVFHMNEGHCAFLAVERITGLMREQKLSYEEAREVVAASTIFTTHTPVPAGIDQFPADLVERYLAPFCQGLKVGPEHFIRLGRLPGAGPGERFNMALLAIHTSCFVNGVSKLHALVSRKMWSAAWPGTPLDEIPITHVTNGTHPGSWISPDMRNLYDRYLGPRWAEEPGDTRIWLRAEEIPGEELWRTHERRRERLVGFARRRLTAQLRARGASAGDIGIAAEVLHPEALTIGFARRFATYKRATLIMRDPERLARLLNNPEQPVQIIFAGKAHPRDEQGKSFIKQIVQLARLPEFRRRIVFLEDYDAVIGRYLVQGVDVWLNNPRRPLEASGTSGMKAAVNGALNLSILDGWWDEAYAPPLGWAIGLGETYADLEEQDRIEAGTLYDLLEREVVPLFYKRGADGQPRPWIEKMRTAMAHLCPEFNTNRMVHQYTLLGYVPARDRSLNLGADNFGRARDLAAWRTRAERAWPGVRIARVETNLPEDLPEGFPLYRTFEVRALVETGGLNPQDLSVQTYFGRVDENQKFSEAEWVEMAPEGKPEGSGILFRGQVPCRQSGLQGFTVRVLPRHPDQAHPHETALVLWFQ